MTELNYTNEYSPYLGDYNKNEYDIILKDGREVLNCYPNAGLFISYEKVKHSEESVDQIRLSLYGKWGTNDFYPDGVKEWQHEEVTLEPGDIVLIDKPDRSNQIPEDADWASFPENVGVEFHTDMMKYLQNTYQDWNSLGLSFLNQVKKNPLLKPLTEQKYQVARNEKCPCESGKKFKNCCMI